MKLWHITISSVRRRTLFPDERQRRRAVRIAIRVADEYLILFSLVDDHFHLVVASSPERLPAIRVALHQALSRATGEALVAHVTPVENRTHLNRLVSYLLRQPGHHGLDVHPALWSGSCFQDLIGARCVSELAGRLATHLPRLRIHDIHEIVGLPPQHLVPADRDALRRAGVWRIAAASAAAFAADPDLVGRTAPIVLARRATVHLAIAAGITRQEIARAIHCTPQRVGQLLAEPIDTRFLRATCLQIALEDTFRQRTVQSTLSARQHHGR